MTKKLYEQISKDHLTEIIDGLYLQIVWVCLCIDSLEAMNNIEKEKFNIANNFFYITHTSLIFRYTMELAKLLSEKEKYSFYRICNLCSSNVQYFESFDIVDYCKLAKKQVNKYSNTIQNIIERRNKTLAHNDSEYYLFSEKVIADFPLDVSEIKEMSTIILNFAKTIQKKIGSKRACLGYPSNSDDVKRLFGKKTDDDILLEEIDNLEWR